MDSNEQSLAELRSDYARLDRRLQTIEARLPPPGAGDNAARFERVHAVQSANHSTMLNLHAELCDRLESLEAETFPLSTWGDRISMLEQRVRNLSNRFDDPAPAKPIPKLSYEQVRLFKLSEDVMNKLICRAYYANVTVRDVVIEALRPLEEDGATVVEVGYSPGQRAIGAFQVTIRAVTDVDTISAVTDVGVASFEKLIAEYLDKVSGRGQLSA